MADKISLMLDQLQKIRAEYLPQIESIDNLKNLEAIELQLFSRQQGKLTLLLRKISEVSKEEKAQFGQLSNEVKNVLTFALNKKREELQEKELNAKLTSEAFDVTLPGKMPPRGHLHPLTQTQYEIEDIFTSLGFTVWDGPEVDTEFNNFDALNVPSWHPARDMQDTFWLESSSDISIPAGEAKVLRTQTSNMQNRILKSSQMPIRAIVPGRVFRSEATDACHEHTFHQLEGLMVDENITLANLLGVLELFLKALYKKDNLKFRIRPGYFPFVEPGLELDMSCLLCSGKGCAGCKHSGWIEVMPCGMIHPNVLKMADVDPDKYQGFAFGFGLTRLVMQKYGISDIRLLAGGNLKFLNQF